MWSFGGRGGGGFRPKLPLLSPMTSDVSEFFFVGSRGNLANYVLLFQVPEPPKKVLKGENKGGTT